MDPRRIKDPGWCSHEGCDIGTPVWVDGGQPELCLVCEAERREKEEARRANTQEAARC